MTHALWTGELTESFHEPSSPNRLALYIAPDQQEVLVEYDELSPWGDSTRRRAYLIRLSALQGEPNEKPRFIASTALGKISPVHIFDKSGVRADAGDAVGIYAITSTNDNRFTIIGTNGLPLGRFELPTYRGATGSLKLALLTPVSLVLDASIVGGIAGYWCLEAALASGQPIAYSTGL